MANFIGTEFNDTANAALGQIGGFTGGSVTELQDSSGDFFAGGGGEDFVFAGNAFDLIEGGEGHDVLNGGAGDDTVYGNTEPNPTGSLVGDEISGNIGDDLIVGSNGGDNIDGGDGKDRCFGNGGDDLLQGGFGGDDLRGGDGNDVMYAQSIGARSEASHNNLIGENGNDVLFGASGNDDLNGGEGNDTLAGGSSNDYMFGEIGNDVFQIFDGETVDHSNDQDPFAIPGDYIDGGDGVDTLDLSRITAFNSALVDLFLGDLRITSDAKLASVISNLEIVIGGDGDDEISGDGGNNTLFGGAGEDVLNGRFGNDRLTGGTGFDILIGDNGNDVFVVDQQGEALERSNRGNDTVLSSVSYALGANLENLRLLGSNNSAGSGNALNNVITGNAGANSIRGLQGNDTLTGGGGSDHFVFSSELNSFNVDTVTDFTVGIDDIRLDDTIFVGLPTGALRSAAFRLGPEAADPTDRIIYDSSTGAIVFDVDGTGIVAGIRFAVLHSGVALNLNSFTVI